MVAPLESTTCARERVRQGQRRDGNQLAQDFFAENLVHALAISGYRWSYQHGVSGGVQLEMLGGMGQRVVRD